MTKPNGSDPTLTNESRNSTGWRDRAVDLIEKTKRVDVLTGLVGHQLLQQGATREHRRLAASEAANHEALYGSPFPFPMTEDDDMETILGDKVTTVTHASGSKLAPLAMVAAGALLGGGGLAGGLALAQLMKPVSAEVLDVEDVDTDTSLDLGLGHLKNWEDLKNGL